jgi:hypothetical protein
MWLLIFQIVAGLFCVFVIVSIVMVVRGALKLQREERVQDDAAIASLTDGAREALKVTGGKRIRRAIIRWEKNNKGGIHA